MTRTETLRERRLKKQIQIRQLQAQIDDIDSELRISHARETHAALRARREATPMREVVSEGCGEARPAVAV